MPSQLTRAEVATVKDMVLDPGLRHMPLRTLSLFAQRTGKVYVSVTTWARLMRDHGWRRPRTRVHPTKPTLGVRATRPNEYWHIDVTVIKLLDGTKTYLHAVIDNYSVTRPRRTCRGPGADVRRESPGGSLVHGQVTQSLPV